MLPVPSKLIFGRGLLFLLLTLSCLCGVCWSRSPAANPEDFRSPRIDLDALKAAFQNDQMAVWKCTVVFHDPAGPSTWLEFTELPLKGYLASELSGLLSDARGGDLLSVSLAAPGDPSSAFRFQLLDRSIESTRAGTEITIASRLELGGRLDCTAYVEAQHLDESGMLDCKALVDGRRVWLKSALPFGADGLNIEESFVKVSGVLQVEPGSSSHPIRTLWVSSLSGIERLDQETKYRFSTDPWGVAAFRDRRDGETIRAVGRVFPSANPGRIIFEDSTKSIEIETEQWDTLEPGVPMELVFIASEQTANRVGSPVFRPLEVRREGDLAEASPAFFEDINVVMDGKDELMARGQRVAIAGIVTAVGRKMSFIIVQDRTGIVRVDLPERSKQRFATSDVVYCEGKLANAAGTVVISLDSSAHLGRRPMPEAAVVSLKQAALEANFQRRIAIEGCVLSLARNHDGLELNVLCADGELNAWVRTSPKRANDEGLKGALVRLEGVSLREPSDTGRGEIVVLGIESMRHVNVIETQSADPFERELSEFKDIQKLATTRSELGLAKTIGAVLHSDGSRRLVMSNGIDALDFLMPEEAQYELGQWLEVVGVPGLESDRPLLRVIARRECQERDRIVAQALKLDHEGMLEQNAALVKYRGEIVSSLEDAATVRLTLSASEQSVNVFLGKRQTRLQALPFKLGDTVEVTGVLRVLEDPVGGIAAPNIVLRDLKDLRILETASFWTPRRLVYLIALSLFALCCGLIWGLYLRLRVASKELLLEKQRIKSESIAQSNRRIMDQASDFVFTLDLEGRFTGFNAAGERITGFKREETLGRSIFDFFDRREALLIYFALRRKRSEANLKSIKLRFLRRDGEMIWLNLSPSFLEEGDEITGGLGIARDITREVEEKKALEKAKALAEENAQAKARFLATMSHELRTPMNGMIGMMSMLLEDGLTRSQEDCVRTVLSSSQALHTILCSILDYSKLESGAMEAEKVPFALGEVVEDVHRLMQASAAAKSISVSLCGIEAVRDRVLGDPGKLRQLLLNVVGNAVKFTEAGSVELRVGIVKRAWPNLEVLFEVLDTGIGIDESEMSKLFAPFQQADSSYSRRFGGTGLGLTISRELVRLLGGEMGVESEKGVGSRFWFSLPYELDAAQSVPDANANKTGKTIAKEEAWLGPDLKILVAEDNPVNQKVIRMQLKKIGLRADYAENGKEAVRAVEETCYDLILMDCQMPEMDGWEATSIIRKSQRNKDIPIIAVTANSSDADKERCREVGMNGFVAKPTSSKKLLDEMIAVVLPGNQRRNPNAVPSRQAPSRIQAKAAVTDWQSN